MKDIYFLTSNAKKASDFTKFGLGVKSFTQEIPEVLSENVEIVVLHKAKDTGLNNIVVEDTSFAVEGSGYAGTEIKFLYQEIRNNSDFNFHNATWEVSLCMKKDNFFYIATGCTKGQLKYPALEVGYHFNTIFAVKKDSEYVHFELLSDEEKIEISPRFKALRKLIHAIEINDFSHLKVIHEKDVPIWTGSYQEEKVVIPTLKRKFI